jgi:hypothetical protein
MQSRTHSVLEVLTGTTVGFIGSWFINFSVFSLSPLGLASNITLSTVGCTVWSLARGYALRRLWNRAAHAHTRPASAPRAQPMHTQLELDWSAPSAS